MPTTLPCFLLFEETSLFSTIASPVISSSNLNEDVLKTTQWVYQWKIPFNRDVTKQAQKCLFSKEKGDKSPKSIF